MTLRAPRKDDVSLTVVIPVYQTVLFIDDCIASVMLTLPSDGEVVLVNDGSTDGSGEKCDEWAVSDSRITVIHQPNAGLSDARNVGIEHAAGEHLLFVDSDDVISPDLIPVLRRLADDAGAQIVVSRGVRFSEGLPPFELLEGHVAGRGKELLSRRIAQGRDWEVWGSLYHRSLFEAGLRFRPSISFEDLEFTPRAMVRAAIVVLSDARLYGYRSRPDSIMARSAVRVSPDLIDVLSGNLDLVRSEYARSSPEYVALMEVFLLHASKRLERIHTHEDLANNARFVTAYREFMRANLKEVARLRGVSHGYRALMVASALNPGVFVAGFGVARQLKAIAPGLSRSRRAD